MLPQLPRRGPTSQARLRRDLPLARDIALFVPTGLAGNPRDLVTGAEFVPNSSFSRQAQALGWGMTFAGTDNSAAVSPAGTSRLTTSNGAGDGDFTIAVFAMLRATTDGALLGSNHNTVSNSNRLWLRVNQGGAGKLELFAQESSSGTNIQLVSSAARFSDYQIALFWGRRSGTTYSVGIDGSQTDSGTDSAWDVYDPSSRWEIGGIVNNAVVPAPSGTVIYAVYGWNRALADAELGEVAARPYALIADASGFHRLGALIPPDGGGGSFQPAWAQSANSIIQSGRAA